MAFREPTRIVVRKPSFSLRVLPNYRFQWQIDADLLTYLHEWRTRLGVTEDQEFCRSQWKTDLRRCSRMINARKYRHAFCSKFRLKPIYRLLGSVIAWHRDQSICSHCVYPGIAQS